MRLRFATLPRFSTAAVLLVMAACTSNPPLDVDSDERIGSIETRQPAEPPERRRQATTQTEALPVPDEREALAQYEALLRQETDPERRAELARRAAELRLQIAAAEEPVPADTQARRPAEAKGNVQDTVSLLESSLSPAPGTPGNDQILYQLARAHDLAGNSEGSQQALSRLIEEHPDSEFQAEALFRRAERHFVASQYRAAEADYRRLISGHRESPFRDPARHKLGWSIFKQGRYREALQKLLPILDEQITAARLNADGSALQLQGMEAAARERLQDSVRVTVLCYALLGGPQHIPPSLRGHSQDYRALLYLRLAGLYEDRGHPEEASGVLEAFLRRHPQDRAVSTARHRNIALLEQSGDLHAALQARADFVDARINSSNPQTRELVAKDLAFLARHYHAEAQKTAPKRSDEYRLALRWYRKLLQHDPDQHGQRYLMAELMLDHGDYLQAARHFETLGYDIPTFDRAREAAYASLLARRKANQGATEAALRFARRYPEHGEADKIQAAAAESQYDQGEYAKAIASAKKVLDGQVPPDLNLAMLSLIAHAHFDSKDFTASEEASRRWLKLAGSQHEEYTAMRSLLATSVYRQAQNMRESDKTAAIDKLLSMRSLAPAELDNPAGKLRASASLQAAQLQMDAQQWAAAIRILQEMRRAFPDHPQQAELARGLALAYEKQGDSKKAAEEYARVTRATDDPDLQRAAAFQTAEMHWQAGRLEAARDAFRDYAHQYKRPLDTNLQAQQRLVEIYERLEDDRRNFWLKKIIETDARAGAARSELSRSMAAKAALSLANKQARAYRRTSLVMPLEKGIKRKQAALEKALQAYSQAADYSVAEVTTAATYHIAEMYRDFGRALLHAPVPEDLPAEEREEMHLLLQDQAFPFEEKAIELHETNITRFEQGLFDEWISKSLQALMDLVPGRYAKRELGERIVEAL